MASINKIDLSHHYSLTTSDEVTKISAPILENFNIKYFRYLKLYDDGSRVMLSNNPQCLRFVYEEGHYEEMWFDGENRSNLVDGWHLWDVKRAIHNQGERTAFEKEINNLLGLYSGKTYISKCMGFYNIYTFDSNDANIYLLDNALLTHFIFYFNDKAQKLIRDGEKEKIIIPSQPSIESVTPSNNNNAINDMPINRYYLNGQYAGVYLTAKEAQCVRWLIIGKSAEEIALIENNSLKTVQCHLENIRKKLNCTKQTQIVKIILDQGLF